MALLGVRQVPEVVSFHINRCFENAHLSLSGKNCFLFKCLIFDELGNIRNCIRKSMKLVFPSGFYLPTTLLDKNAC